VDVTVFVVVRDDGRPVGCGALRPLDDSSAEIKRMYVEPGSRGTGAAVAVLRALERRAAARGWVMLMLETGRRQPEAIRFYEREGYRQTEPFGPYADEPGALCYMRSLTGPGPSRT
jgi:GNAT superfamily N-acetyltransferase